MAFGGFAAIQRVLMKFEADTREASRDVRKFKTQAQKDAFELSEAWGKAAAAVAGIATAAVIAGKGLKDFAETSRLEAQAAGKSIDLLKLASQNLLSEMDLLKLAAAANTGTFKLNQEQLETVTRATVELGRRTGDMTKATEAVRKAITEGEVDPLKELGVVLDTTGTNVDKLNTAMEAMTRIAGDAGGGMLLAGEEALVAGVTFQDAMRNMSEAVGQLSEALVPAIQQLAAFVAASAAALDDGFSFENAKRLAKVTARYALPAGHLIGLADDFGLFDSNKSLDELLDEQDREGVFREGRTIPRERSLDRGGAAEAKRAEQRALQRRQARLARQIAEERRKRRAAETALESNLQDRINLLSSVAGEQSEELERIRALRDAHAKSEGLGDFGSGIVGDSGLAPPPRIGGLGEDPRDRGQRINIRGGRAAQQIFGDPGQLVKMQDTFSQLAQVGGMAFNTLQVGAASMFDALITGSESFGKAFKGAIAEALRGVAVQMGVEALKNTALGTAAIALGPIGGISAGMYFKAAGIAAATAVAAGAGARLLGAGQGGSPTANASGAIGAGASFPRGGGGSGGTRSTTIILGSDFAEDSPRRRRARIHRAIVEANREVGGHAQAVEFA